MPAFEYTGRDSIGNTLRGVLDAEDDAQARRHLRDQGLFITSLRLRARRGLSSLLPRRPDPEEISALTFHLAGLVESGVPIMRSLALLREQTEHPALRQAIADIEESIESGSSLSTALRRHPALFSPLYVGVVRTGETAGALAPSLVRLTDYLDREAALRQKVRSMFVYPTFVLAMAVVVTGVFLTVVVPIFERVYAASGASLPLLTQALLSASRATRPGWPAMLTTAACAALGFWVLTRPHVQSWLRQAGLRLLLRTPRLGNVARMIQASRFVRSFGLMQASGVPVLTALDVTIESSSDPRMRGAIDYLKERVSRGARLSEAMRSAEAFPPMVHRMVAMGEESGRLDAMLQRASDLLERETDYAIRKLVTLAEPMLTIALGGVVALVLLALYLPIFGLPKALLR